MASLTDRITNMLRRVSDSFRKDCTFSFGYALLRLADEVGGRIHLNVLSRWAHKKKDNWIFAYLQTQLSSVIDTYAQDEASGIADSQAPIWVCWWTGKETAPELVRKCIASIYKNAGPHPVHFITKDNCGAYIRIPDFMLQKVADGDMGLAHLADYIRVKLLAQYGGLWLDATIFCSGQVPELCFELPVFTLKGPVRESNYISNYRWVTFCLGGWKGNVFYRFLADAFEHYWQNNRYAIDYLFFDHIINLAYETIPNVRKLLDQVPDNNIHRDDLQAAMNAALPASQFGSVLQEDTALYKLSWRESYAKVSTNGEKSVYQHFLEYTV